MNDKHYPAGSSKGGQFAPKNGSVAESGSEKETGTGSALSYVPKTNRDGTERWFFSDLPVQTQQEIEQAYVDAHYDILSASDDLYDNNKTHIKNDYHRQMQREMWVNEVIEEQLKQGKKEKQRRATIVIGIPGSGKSTIAKPLAEEMGAFTIDADDFKQKIPEFIDDVRMAGAVHQESVNLSNKMRNELSEDGYNMVIGKVGGDYKSVEGILNELADYDYQVDVILCDTPLSVAYDRAIGRFDRGETNRLVPFWTMKVADKNVFNTFDEMLKHPAVIGGQIFSNDVPEGEEPKLIKRFEK